MFSYSGRIRVLFTGLPNLSRFPFLARTLRLAHLQPGEIVVAEKIDRISRLPLAKAEPLVASIRAKDAQLAVRVLLIYPSSRPKRTGLPELFWSRFRICF